MEKGNDKGDLVYDVRPALRYKSLPDLFAGSLPKKTAAPEAVPLPVPAAAPKKDKEPPKKDKKEWTLPIVCGAVHEGEVHLVILNGRDRRRRVLPVNGGTAGMSPTSTVRPPACSGMDRFLKFLCKERQGWL